LFCLPIILIYGCTPAAKPPEPKPPEVLVAKPTEAPFLEFEEFTGRIWSPQTIDIKARVSGYLDKVLFADGADVKEKQPLFQIDPRPFKAELDRAEAVVTQTETRLKRLNSQVERSEKLIQNNAISKEEYELLQYDRDEAKAALSAAKAALLTADINLKFTTILSPITGRISRRLVDPGSLIKTDDTLLANVVSLNPIYAYFDMDERTVLKLRRMLMEKNGDRQQADKITVKLALADQKEFNIPGTLNFTDNQIDANTGTLRLRAEVSNDNNLLSPGMFIRCRYPIGEEHKALFVPENALVSDQGEPYVYVLNEKDEVLYRKVDIGPLKNGQRVIRSNLKPEDRIVVSGLQRVRPNIKVTPKFQTEKSDKGVAGVEAPKSSAVSNQEKQTNSTEKTTPVAK
jgi:RND family efflux transporter MFP subunit